MDVKAEYTRWCTDPVFDEATHAELRAITDEKEIEDRFYKNLSFGTGGLRGVIGAGTNRMNLYTVGKATQGLADFIRTQTPCGSVAIAYDSRRMSPEFAMRAACILAANGIKAYLFESLRPTPELSFAVRFLHATAGIVITASHNPPQYNGYKVYWSDGGQIVPPYDKEIIGCVNAVRDYDCVRTMSEEEAKKAGMLEIIGKTIDDAYMSAIKDLVLEHGAIQKMAKQIRIVYTPLNGTGYMPVMRVLKELGFEQVFTVPEQAQPDGNFPTLRYPNPEDPAAFSYALALAEKVDADIVLATDPDADRLGVYAKDAATGKYMPFTGNMSGLLIAEYELSRREAKGLLPADRADGALVTTIVSSNMAFPVARAYGLSVIEVLTGFKYIGEQIRRFEEARAENGGRPDHTKGAYVYEFGFEESYGCLVGTHARDKDAVVAVMALCEAAAYYQSLGKTLWDQMLEIYAKYGYYREALESITIPGADGADRIEAIIAGLRANIPQTIGPCRVIAMRDYRAGVRTSLADGTTTALALPKSNVLYFELEEDGWCCVRPSGTEPKIKFYFGVRADTMQKADEKLRLLKAGLLELAE